MKDNLTINDQISIIVKDEIQRQPTPIRCTITKIYDDNRVDILTNNNNILQYVETLGTPSLNSLGILFFFNRDFNDYIVLCNVNIDIVEDYMKTRNYFYKKIAEKLNNKTYDKPYTDYYYLTEILKAYEIEYSSNYTIGKLLHDFSEAVTSNTYDECLTDEYYLKTIADYLTSADNGYKTSIYYLKLIYENIDSNRNSITLTINHDNVIIGDEVNLTAVMLDSDRQPIINTNVTFKANNVNIGNGSTDNEGKVIIQYQTDYTGSISIIAESNEIISNIVLLTVNKKTSVLTVTSPVNNGSYGSELIVSGTLLSNDSEALSSKSILVKEGDTLLTTLTTDSDGVFDGIVSGLTGGYHTLSILFEEDSYCTGSSASRSISVVVPSSMTLTSDKSVLSYADSESASLTATVLDNNGDAMSGQTVSMKVYKVSDDSLIDTLSVFDNNDGTYTATYNSNVVGDVYIKAECNLLMQTYSLQDCLISDSMTSDSGHYTGSPTNKSYSNNGMTINNSNWTAWKYNESLSQGTSIEFDIISLSGSEWNMYMPFYDSNNTEVGAFNAVSSKVNFLSTTENVTSAVGSWRLEIKDGSLKAYLNNVLALTTAFTTSPFSIGWLTGGSRSFTIKNLKIKPL